MGIDSLNLLPHLLRLSSSPEEMFDGKTGSLYLDAEHRIHRQLIWAQFGRGGTRILGYAPRLPDTPGEGSDSHLESPPIDEPVPDAPPPAVPESSLDDQTSR